MGSFRSSIQVSSAEFDVALLRAAGARAIRKNFDSRRARQALFHVRSLLGAYPIVKQRAEGILVLLLLTAASSHVRVAFACYPHPNHDFGELFE